jgi:Cu/Ag efflux pump CusA
MLVLCSLPSTLTGGVLAVFLTGGTLTLGSMVGFVALFGMAARNTILLVSHFDHLVRKESQSSLVLIPPLAARWLSPP